MEIQTLRDLYIAELKDLYSAEKQLIEALPRLTENSVNPELKAAFVSHLEQAKEHALRLATIFEGLGTAPDGSRCCGMAGLIEEGNELLRDRAAELVRDAGLISKAQRFAHYEMAAYGSVRSFAFALGERDHAAILQQTLDEEVRTDKLLTLLAESSVNADAAMPRASGDAAAD
jgi:ferritin-like metal-binding protein YciE